MHDTVDYPAAYTAVEGSSDEQILLLIKWLDVPPSKITVVGPGKRNLGYSDIVQRLIHSGASSSSVRQRQWGWRPTVLALWLDDRGLAEIERSSPARMAVAPWLLRHIELWRRSREPKEITGSHNPTPVQLNPVVGVAMESVLVHSNPNNGLTGYNRNAAVQAFRELRKHGYTWDPVETAAVMARGGWSLEDATDFAKLAEEMLAGKALRGGNEFRPDIMRIWREEAGAPEV